ncbi:MAG: MFS transporter [Pseudomonadota bacterium]
MEAVIRKGQENQADAKVIFALFLVHFIGDFYASFINPLLPVLSGKLGLTLAQVGIVAGLSRFLAFIVQPSVGYLADHYRTRFFILGGPFLSILFIPLLGAADSFALVLLFVALGSIGSAMFHPPAAGMVPVYAGRSPGLAMSLFNLGGTISFAIGPLLVAWWVTHQGLEKLPYLSLFGLAVMVVLFILTPRPEGEGLKNLGFIGSLKEIFGSVWKQILIIWILIVFRTFVSQSFMTFIPILFMNEGHSLLSIGGMLSLYITAAALSGVLAGHWADRIGYKPIFVGAYVLATPCLYLFLHFKGALVYAGAFMAGFSILATMPLAVALAQEIAPKGRSLVASLMMGLAFGTGGILTPLTGMLADHYSIRTVLDVVLWIPLLAAPLIWKLPERVRKSAA